HLALERPGVEALPLLRAGGKRRRDREKQENHGEGGPSHRRSREMSAPGSGPNALRTRGHLRGAETAARAAPGPRGDHGPPYPASPPAAGSSVRSGRSRHSSLSARNHARRSSPSSRRIAPAGSRSSRSNSAIPVRQTMTVNSAAAPPTTVS